MRNRHDALRDARSIFPWKGKIVAMLEVKIPEGSPREFSASAQCLTKHHDYLAQKEKTARSENRGFRAGEWSSREWLVVMYPTNTA